MITKKADLHEEANNAAIRGDFKKAIKLNQQIITESPNDIDAYLRLGFAYMQVKDFPNARKSYKKALKFEPLNQIAKNNLDKIYVLEKKKTETGNHTRKQDIVINPNLFLNVVGKTKEVSLVNIGQADILADLQVGERAFFKIKKRRVEVRNKANEYIGALPDDISKRLMFFLDAKSVYSIFIKATAKNSVDIFITEEKKGRKVKKYISFPKNIQDDLKSMIDGVDEENPPIEEHDEDDDTDHLDIEELADSEIEDTDSYETKGNQFDDDGEEDE